MSLLFLVLLPIVVRAEVQVGIRGIETETAAEPVIEPGQTYGSWGKCIGGGVPQYYMVCLKIDAVETPGHGHLDSPPVVFLDAPCRYRVPGNTDVNWRWVAPDYAARVRFVTEFHGWCETRHVSYAQAKIKDLAELAPGSGYRLVPGPSAHEDDHWASTSTIAALQTVAREHQAAFPEDPVLEIEALSLPWGGLLDKGSDWRAPYAGHRRGCEADVDWTTVPEAHRPWLADRLGARGGKVSVEGGAYHADFCGAQR